MIHLADPVVAGVGDEEVPGGVHRDTGGVAQFGGGGLTVIAAVARRAVAGDGGDDRIRPDRGAAAGVGRITQYEAVIVSLPTANVEVLRVAVPDSRVAVPSVVLPSLKVTVPVGSPEPDVGETVAAKATDWP